MSKKIGVVVVLVGICALGLFLVSCGSSSSRPSGLLYVLTQGSSGTGNNVSSFSIDLGSGGLSLVNANAPTCATGSTCGPPLDIVLDPTAATAFVLNQGVPCTQGGNCVNPCGPAPLTACVSVPPTIYPYTVNSDGSLSSPGTPTLLSHPTSSQDIQDDADAALTMVRDAAGQFLFVVNQGSVPAPANCVGDPLPQGNFDACPSISVYSTSSTNLTLKGGSILHPGSPLHLSKNPTAISTITFPVPSGVTNAPCGATTTEEYVFVTSSHDLSNQHFDNALSVYCVDSSGNLTDLTPDPPYTPEVNPLSVLAVNTTPAGTSSGGVFVYVGSQPGTGGGALRGFQMCTTVNTSCGTTDVANAVLRPVGSAPTTIGANPVGMVVDPTNKFLYVVGYIQSAVDGFQIAAAGTLSPLTPASQPTGAQPVAIALHPSVNNTGQFLFTSNSAGANISSIVLSTTTGSMSSPTTVTSPSTPSGMAVR
jgi:hypothetical protein